MTRDDDEGALDIRAGGLIAVDTASLRHAAGVLERLGSDCGDVAALLRHAAILSRGEGWGDPAAAGRAEDARDRALDLAGALRHRADVYELVERHATDSLSPDGSAAASEAARLWGDWRMSRHNEIDAQLAGAAGPLYTAALVLGSFSGVIAAVGRGTLSADDPPLTPATRPAVVHEVSRDRAAPPRTLAEIAARMPSGDGRVRVETYETDAGGREHVVYIAGTQSFDGPYAEPWDMASNFELYLGTGSSSYDATERALAAAGAVRGDRVHVVGHSQGAMIGVRLARESDLDIATLVTFASPVEADLDDDVLVVTLRHRDDPVVALSDGGLPTVAGSPDSFVAERVADPPVRWGDPGLSVHVMGEYRETAERVDASDDARVQALHERLAGIGAAAGAAGGTAVGTAIVYGARRDVGATPSSSSSGGSSGAASGGRRR